MAIAFKPGSDLYELVKKIYMAVGMAPFTRKELGEKGITFHPSKLRAMRQSGIIIPVGRVGTTPAKVYQITPRYAAYLVEDGAPLFHEEARGVA